MIPAQDPLLFDELPFWSAPFGITLLDTVHVRSGMQVLDIGSGGGFPMLELAGRLDEDSLVTGLDPSEDHNTLVREKIRKREIGNARVVTGSAERMPFGDCSFDLVVSNNGLNNVQDLAEALKESLRVLKSAGQMVFTVNLPGTFSEFYDVYEELLKLHMMEAELKKLKDHIFEKRKPVIYLRDLVLQTGFRIQSIQPEGFKYRFTDGTSFFSHYLIRNFFLPPWRRIIAEDKADELFAELEMHLNGIASDAGHLEMSVPFVTFDLTKPESGF
jgi:arsenite methyltransferase